MFLSLARMFDSCNSGCGSFHRGVRQCCSASETVAEVEQHQKDLCLTRQSDEARLKHLSTWFWFGRRTKRFESRSQKLEANTNQWKVSANTTLRGAQPSDGMSAVGSETYILILIQYRFKMKILLRLKEEPASFGGFF